VTPATPPAGYTRQCFLTSLDSVDSSWTHSSDYVQVKYHANSDSTHSQAGWYIEGQISVSQGGYHPEAEAHCYDVPAPTDAGSYHAASGDKTTYAGYLAACGLTALGGAFTTDSLSSGVYLDRNASGYWVLHASSGKWGDAVCLSW
jgi:hypothetical protein